jgi:hypothetical protein
VITSAAKALKPARSISGRIREWLTAGSRGKPSA